MTNTLTLQGIEIPIGPHISPLITGEIAAARYEQQEFGIVSRTIESDDVVMELGTGLGFIATFCARRCGSEHVHTYEANPALEPHIRSLFERNGVSPQLKIGILGKGTQKRDFYVSEQFWSSSVLPTVKDGKLIQVEGYDLMEEINKVRPTYLIVDIEGGEFELLTSIDFRDLPFIRKILLEVHGDELGPERVQQLSKHLAESGFRVNRTLSFTPRRRAYLAVADILGQQTTDKLLALVGLRARGDRQENRFFERGGH